MYVDEFLTELYADELSDHFVGNRHIPADSRPKLFPLMNTAMRYAYSRWKCKYSSEMLSIVDNTKEYELVAEDVLQIVQIVNVYGLDVPQRDYQVWGKTIYFPDPETQTVEVIYKVKHTAFVVAQDDETTLLELPDMLIPWLKAQVAYRFFQSMGTESTLAKAANFLSQAKVCEDMYEQWNSSNEFSAPTNRKLESRGFA